MGVKLIRPITPGQRAAVRPDFSEITKKKPEKSLLLPKKQQAGRNVGGSITTRHRGGGHKRHLRIIDFKRDKTGVPGTVQAIEYDPNRAARLALVNYADGEKRYMLAPLGLNVGDAVMSGPKAEIKTGNAMALRLIPTGTMVHCIELRPGTGAQMVRGAGTAAQVMAREESLVLVRLPSGEVRRVQGDAMATIGQVGNVEHKTMSLGKAGRRRNLGWRPEVRGAAMSPRDHPHGGGEGRNPRGMPGPKTPWGKPALGPKTRRRHDTDWLRVRDRRV